MPRSDAPIMIVSHRRSGTHLLIDAVRRQFACCDAWKWPWESMALCYVPLETITWRLGGRDPASAEPTLRRCRRPILKTHTTPDLASLRMRPADEPFVRGLVERAQVIHLHRDPRPVLVSLWRYLKYQPLGRMPFPEFLRQSFEDVNVCEGWARQVAAWWDEPGVHHVSYEALVSDPVGEIEKIGQFIGETPRARMPTLPAPVRGKWPGRVHCITRFRPRSTAIVSQTVGLAKLPGWSKLTTEADEAFLQERCRPWLDRLGYRAAGR